jgi:hypothetical protein
VPGPRSSYLYQEFAPGFSIGAFVGYGVSSNLKLTSGLNWKRNVAKYSDTYYDEEAQEMTTRDIRDAIDQLGIPLLFSYYPSSLNEKWFWLGGISMDFLLSATTTTYYVGYGQDYVYDLFPYYKKKLEFTFEIGAGYDFSLGNRSRLELSLTYSQPFVNPYNDVSIANGFHTIKLLRFGAGIIWF